MTFITTVNRAKLDSGDTKNPIRVTFFDGSLIGEYEEVEFSAGARIIHGDPLQDGATVWIESPHVRPLRRTEE